MTENKINREMAESEFDRFMETMGVEYDESTLDAESISEFKAHRERIVKAIERGSFVVNDEGEGVFTPEKTQLPDGGKITFHEPTGETVQATDNGKAGKPVAKIHYALAQLTKQPVQTFVKLHMKDYKVCQSVITLFLA